MKNTPNPRGRHGFTLLELIVTIGTTIALGVIIFMLSITMREKAARVVCLGKLRVLGSAVIARGMDNNDRPYTREEIGNSSYRSWGDPLSLCQVLKEYVSAHEAWTSPGAHKKILKFNNSYAWSRATNLVDQRASEITKPWTTAVMWNNHTFLSPSVYNVPEGTGGPRTTPGYRYYPWKRFTAINWVYLDGHVETK